MSHSLLPALDYPAVGQTSPLLIHRLLDRVLTWAPDQKIIYREQHEFTYREFYERVNRLAGALTRLGVGPGDKVGVMDWDSHRYLELFFAVPMLGAVLHTINVRLSPEQTLFTINHAGDKVVLSHTDFLPLVGQMAPHLKTVQRYVLLTDDGHGTPPHLTFAGEYEALLAAEGPVFAFHEFDENAVATLFYTTGTTGEPKGVFFSHRQIVLHTMGAGVGLAAFRHPASIHSEDVYMPLTPMFHVHAWGVPYLATLLGIKQVYPGRYEPQLLLHLLAKHAVTFSHCVPTILQMLLHHPASKGIRFDGLKLIIGGAALPKGLATQAMDRGIKIAGGYGMSETCPIVAVSNLKPEAVEADAETQLDLLTRTGFPLPLVRAQVLNAEGKALPPGKENVGELVLQAPWLTPGYYKEEAKSLELWRSGWLHTGDIAYMDSDGYIRITDRLKDVIKIGGEWISSLELENALSQHEAVKDVAVVGLPDPKWDERPHAEVVLKEEFRGKVTPRMLAAFLHGFIDRGAIHKRAILTEIHLVETLPRTSVGKMDKKALRAQAGVTSGSEQAMGSHLNS